MVRVLVGRERVRRATGSFVVLLGARIRIVRAEGEISIGNVAGEPSAERVGWTR